MLCEICNEDVIVDHLSNMCSRCLRFSLGNDKLWGEDNWIACSTCPRDDYGGKVYHHKDAHESSPR